MDQTKQDALLGQVQKGKNAGAWAELNARKWFEDLLAEAIEIYVSHPSTLSAMSFSGIAFLPEWPQIGLNTAQAWEPASDET
jgi:gluconate 2-dehydrogenase gamma chain